MAPLFTGLRLGFGRSAEVAVAPVSGLTATGGVISDYPSGGYVYRAHVFTSTGTFAVTAPGGYGDTVEIFAIGGGGGGSGGFPGYGPGRGGGAGGAFVATSYPVSLTTYPVAVGAGGGGAKTGPVSSPFATGRGSSGGNSTFTSPSPQVLTAAGGGGGGDYDGPSAVAPVSSGGPGGCGGGGGGYPGAPAPNIAGGTATQPSQNPGVYNLTNYGFAGGTGDSTTAGGGGAGGGTGGVGDNYSAPASTLRSGGPGIPITYAYGTSSPVTYGAGGPTGGPNTGPTVDATYSTGNGGMGWLTNPSPSRGGNGGSGIVVVRYQIASLTATAKATGGLISFYSGKTIHTFTSSDTFTITNPSLTSADILVIAGGGSGGGVGGGGAGGFVFTPGQSISNSPGIYPISVGAGGAAYYWPGGPAPAGNQGTASHFGPGTPAPIPATGGGAGGGWTQGPGGAGGSGGGGGMGPGIPTYAGGAGTNYPGPTQQGYPGGSASSNSPYAGAGGGGAGGIGGNANDPSQAGHGGLGRQIPSVFRNSTSTVGAPGPTAPVPGTNPGGDTSGLYWVCGGGGGGAQSPGPISAGKGGGAGGPYAGGGDGLRDPGAGGGDPAIPAKQNTGGGGGGMGISVGGAGGGGSGIVIIAYPS